MQIDQSAPTFWYGIKQLHRANVSSISLSLMLVSLWAECSSTSGG
jgi:hypothetical protein